MKANNDVDIKKAEQVIDLVAEGRYLADALTECQLSRGRFSKLRTLFPELDATYARATEIRAEVEVDELVRIADDETIPPLQARNMIDVRKWRAPKFNKKFREQLDLNVNETVSIATALTDAKGRVKRLNCDSAQIEDAQVIDSIRLPAPNASGVISVEPVARQVSNPFDD